MKWKDGDMHINLRYHADHKEEPTLRVYLKAPGAYTCGSCQMPGLDPCLKCIFETCDFHLHKTCHNLTLNSKLRPDSKPSPFFTDCEEFEFLENPVKDGCGNLPYCDACGLDIKGSGYRCTAHPYNPHDLHPICAGLTHADKRKNENGLVFKLEKDVESKCLKCRKRYPVEECIPFEGLKWVCKKREWSFPFCFGGRRICYHLKCMNEIQSSTGGSGLSTNPNMEYFDGGLKQCFTDLFTTIQDSI